MERRKRNGGEEKRKRRRRRGREGEGDGDKVREREMRAHSRSGAWKRAIGEVIGWRGCAMVLVLVERRERERRREWARRTPEEWREINDERERRDPGDFD